MYYYKIVGDLVYKYEVKLDLINLHKIKNEIINNCSMITHKKYKTITPLKESLNIKNYKETKVGLKIYGDDRADRDEYLVEYDEYEFSPLVHYIVDLMLGQTNAIERIEGFKEQVEDIDSTIESIKRDQEVIMKNLDKITATDIKLNLLANKRKQLIDYQQKKELNKNRISANKYRKDVLKCITLKEVALIPLNHIILVESFLEDAKDTTMENRLEKKLVRK